MVENGGGDTGENTSEESKLSRVEAREEHVDCIYDVVYVDVANISFSYIIVYISTVIYVTVVSRSSTSPLPSPLWMVS